MTGTNQAPARNRAAEWLITQFEVTNPDSIGEYDAFGEFHLSAHIQPMFQLKSDMRPGAEMHVTGPDYRDPGRWWL